MEITSGSRVVYIQLNTITNSVLKCQFVPKSTTMPLSLQKVRDVRLDITSIVRASEYIVLQCRTSALVLTREHVRRFPGCHL